MRKNLQIANAKIIARTNAIVVGDKYFLSSFYDKSGAWVIVEAKSTKKNSAGWPSSVSYRVIESVDDTYHGVGHMGTCNATNLYETREAASHINKKF